MAQNSIGGAHIPSQAIFGGDMLPIDDWTWDDHILPFLEARIILCCFRRIHAPMLVPA
jgi:hypothetical protein